MVSFLWTWPLAPKKERCCELHAALKEAADVIKLLEEMKCQEPRRSFTWQCPACALGDGERTRRRTGGLGRPNDLGRKLQYVPVPLHPVTSSSEKGWLKAFAVGCSNFSIQYNYQSASIALAVMATQADRYVSDPKKADFGAAAWILHWLLAVVFAGSVAGMLSMGCLGDLIGHGRALLVTKGLVVLGCFMCTLLPEQPDESGFWGQLILWRFIIGVGLGGAYPLTAAVAGKANDVGKALGCSR
eukprot:g1133.t1